MTGKAVHWAGGVTYVAKGTRRIWLPGWPCCCSGQRARQIASDPSRGANRPEDVTCLLCKRRLAYAAEQGEAP